MNKFIIKDNKKGFTLVEIIVVLIIIAILAAIAIPAFTGYIDKSKIAVMEHNQGQVLRTLQLLVIDGEISKNAPSDKRAFFRNSFISTGAFVANPLNKNALIISNEASSKFSGVIISQRTTTKWDNQINNPGTYLYPMNSNSTNSKIQCEGSVIIQIVSEGALVYYYYEEDVHNIVKVPISYK